MKPLLVSLRFRILLPALTSVLLAACDQHPANTVDAAGTRAVVEMKAEMAMISARAVVSLMLQVDQDREELRGKALAGPAAIAKSEYDESKSELKNKQADLQRFLKDLRASEAELRDHDFSKKIELYVATANQLVADMRTGDSRNGYSPEQRAMFQDYSDLCGMSLKEVSLEYYKARSSSGHDVR